MEDRRFSDKFFEIVFRSTREKLTLDAINFVCRARYTFMELTHKYENYISTMKNCIMHKETQFAGLLRVGYSQMVTQNMMDMMQIKLITTEIAQQHFKENEATLSKVKKNIEAEIRRVEQSIQDCFTALKEEYLRRVTSLKRETMLYMDMKIVEFDSGNADRILLHFKDIDALSKLDSSDIGNIEMLLNSPANRGTHSENVELMMNFMTFSLDRWGEKVQSFGNIMVNVESLFFENSRLVHANQFNKLKEHSRCNDAIRSYYGYLCTEINNLMITIHRIIGQTLEQEY